MSKKDKSKFNVSQTIEGKLKRTHDGILFSSELECNYYKHLLQQKAEGKVVSIELQPKYLLQEAYIKNGKKYNKIEYVSDFLVVYSDMTKKTIDAKGQMTPDFKLKLKLWNMKYPDEILECVSYSKIDNGWILYDDLVKARKQGKKNKLNCLPNICC